MHVDMTLGDPHVVTTTTTTTTAAVDLRLARVVPSAVTVRLYCKGNLIQDSRCMRIENIGAEEFAYLTHIIDFYDRLAPITIFTLGSIYNDQWKFLKCRKLNFVLSQIDTPEKRARFSGFATMAHQAPDSFMEFEGYFKLESYRQHAGGPNAPACRASKFPLDKWFKEFVNVSLENARHIGVLYNPIFAVSRERIHRFPKADYEKLIQEVLRCKDHEHAGVIEAGHFLERSWKAMFDDLRPDGGIKCCGHFGQKKGDPMCCGFENNGETIGMPWTICKAEWPNCSGFVHNSGWGTCIAAGLPPREDVCPEEIQANSHKAKAHKKPQQSGT
ncbi:unnamed protein product [Polarella glacialis]|uniref:Uncharacterized protein n=1 Tax=Polarella glacialis TaxID=89957 RepID=A0A813J8C9_POLGL|nr:unnamed protein product [Polarella glacialis]